MKSSVKEIAIINEEECIGCTKCIQACPVDAIIGSAKLMHTVISHECIGCKLCVEPCPVDCVAMVEVPNHTYDKNLAKKRHKERKIRLLKEEEKQQQVYLDKKQDRLERQNYILAALKRTQIKQHDIIDEN